MLNLPVCSSFVAFPIIAEMARGSPVASLLVERGAPSAGSRAGHSRTPLTAVNSLLAGEHLRLLRWNCSSMDKLCFAAFLWFLLSDGQECGKTGSSSAPKKHRRGGEARFLQNLRNIIQVSKGML